MDKFQKNIDKMISRILKEEIELKSNKMAEQVEEGEWTEITVDEDLKGNQKKLDVAEPKGKLTAADFKKLRSKKKEAKESNELDEFFYNLDNEDSEEEEAEELSKQEPTYVGKGLADNKIKADIKNKIFGSFDDEHGWFDQRDAQQTGDFDFDYDEEEFEDFPSLMAKYGDKQSWFHPKEGEKFFNMYKDKFGGKPFRVRTPKGLEEDECNECGGQMQEAKGKKCPKCGMVDCKCKHKKETKEGKEKWIQKTDMKKGALHKKLGVPEGDKIPQAKLKSLKKELMKKGEGDKKLSAADSKLLKQVNLALTLKSIKEGKNKLTLTENELIDMIEKIVMEEKTVKDKAEKDNITKKNKPEGLKKTEKVLGADKKENDDYAKQVVKKMKDYVKTGSKGEYTENPESFPQNNYQLGDMKEKTKKYHPSQAVDEYIDAFAYPGMTNIVYDEIKPEDEKIERQLKGHRLNGNAEVDESGKALGNVVPSKVGEKMYKNYKENLYGAEQMNASYKRQPMPVDVAGETQSGGSLKKLKGSSSQKASKILNQLESTEDKNQKVIQEEMEKMKKLIGYNKKTQ